MLGVQGFAVWQMGVFWQSAAPATTLQVSVVQLLLSLQSTATMEQPVAGLQTAGAQGLGLLVSNFNVQLTAVVTQVVFHAPSTEQVSVVQALVSVQLMGTI
jgi:hypothetical protein